MKAMKTIVAAVAAAVLLSASASGGIKTVSYEGTGAWMDSFAMATNYSYQTKTPLVFLWTDSSCGYCAKLEAALESANFKTYQAASPYAYCFVMGVGKKDVGINKGSGAKEFAKTAAGTLNPGLGAFPFVCLYWPRSDGTFSATAFAGRDGEMLVKEAQQSLDMQFIDSVEKFFEGYSAYNGGKFTVGSTVGDRLEAEASTEWVDVLIERDSAVTLDPAVEKLTLVYPTGATASASEVREIAWAQGECEKCERVVFADLAGFSFSVGGKVALSLAKADGEALDESLIALVKRGNSPKNPLWVGVKSPDEIAWGEWTMDIDAARDKVAAELAGGGEAHLMVCFGGSIWCPDCAKTDHYLIDTPEFKAWTIANKVACIAIDVPNLSEKSPLTGPCLFTREKRNVSAAYSAADPDHGTVQSGAGYLSRWMVSDAAAEEVLARNRLLVGRNTLNGGWNRPERPNQYRTGVPVFALVNPSTMRVVSRIELFSVNSPVDANALAGHLRRFDELLAVEGAVDVALEEDNQDVSTTTAELVVGGDAAEGVVSGGDLVDMYALSGVGFDSRTVLTATPAVESGIEWRLSLVQVGDAGTKTVATASGIGELSVFGDLNAEDGAAVYAKVEVTGLGSTAASFGADVDATIPYALAAKSTAVPGVVGFDAAAAEAFVPNGRDFSVSVSRVGGRSGAVKARVYLKDAGSAADYWFEDTILEWGSGEDGARQVPFEAWRPAGALASGSFVLGVEVFEGGDSVGTGSCTVTLTDTAAPCFAYSEMEVSAHLAFVIGEQIPLVNVKAGVAAKLKKVSGSLPKGISLSYDRKTGTAMLKGTPKTTGTFTATYTITQNKETGLPATITIAVDDPKAVNPFIGVKRAAQAMPILEEAVGGTSVVAGALAVSATAAGKVKAVLETIGGSKVSCSGSWTDLDSATGTAFATLAHRNGTIIALEMDADGVIRADVNDGEFFGEIAAPGADFADWAGSYTVTFPEDPSEEGDASMATATMTIAASGAVKWSATLSNAQSASGSSQLVGYSDDIAYVALFKSSKAYVFSSLLKIRRGGGKTWSDQSKNQIIHNAPGTATFESIDGEEFLRAAYGGWWTPNAAPTDLLAAFGYGDELTLESDAFDVREVLATRTGFTLEVAVRGDKFAYAKNTGAFSGAITVPGADGRNVKATIKGVLLPGWYSCGCEEPAEGEEELVTRPFGAGIAYFKIRDGRIVSTVSVPVYLKTKEEN